MRTSEVLDTAANVIEERGWSPFGGWNQGDGSSVCIEGAIMAAMGMTYNAAHQEDMETIDIIARCPATLAVKDYLGWERALYAWNDLGMMDMDTRRSRDEVLEVLRGTAEKERIKEAEHGDE